MVLRCVKIRACSVRAVHLNCQRHLSHSSPFRISKVEQLPTWDLDQFRESAFKVQVPVKLPATELNTPPACRKWFIHDSNPSYNLTVHDPPQTSELRSSFWSEHDATIVPLELKTREASTSKGSPSSNFTRNLAPLKILLSYLSNPVTPSGTSLHDESHSIYLAQCELTSLPPSLQADLPTPNLVTASGKGDIYSSSLWMGRPPTYTPLHRDPNPNLFVQLAGQKVIRLMPPEVGDAVFDDVQERLAKSAGSASSSRFRGEEMMAGPEVEVLHRAVWEDDGGILAYACEARLGLGEALFIPKGWWHSVKGVGDGVTASANWWFR